MSPAKRRQYRSGSIYRRADGKWVGAASAGFTTSGTRRRVTVVAATEAEAKRRLKERVRQLETDGRDALNTSATVKSWSDTWLDTRVNDLRPASYTAARSAVRCWIVPAIGKRRLRDLTPGDIRAVHAKQRTAGNKSSSIARTHGVLLKMLNDAIAEGHPIPTRVVQVDKPRLNEPDRGPVATSDAIALLTVAASRDDGSRWAAALLQGMRQGECLGLTWACVDLDGGTLDVSWQLQALPYKVKRDPSSGLRVPDGYEHRQLDGALCLVRPKTQKGQRTIPLTPWMNAALTTWRDRAPHSPYDLVWPRPDGRPADAKDDREDWYQLQRDAGVTGDRGRLYVPHEARHSTATLLLEAGVDPSVVTAILGHASITTSRGYQQISPALTRAALEQVAARLQLT